MKIGIIGPFFPSLGGIETFTALLARNFASQGHRVCILTASSGDDAGEGGSGKYTIHRQLGPWEILSLCDELDILLSMGVGLRTLWAPFLLGKPVVISHQTWLSHGGESPLTMLKGCVLHAAENIAISAAVASSLPCAVTKIPDCFDEAVFQNRNLQRSGDLLFVGRLVSDKGADLLLGAVRRLNDAGLRTTLTVVGSGPERGILEDLTLELGIAGQVTFAGPLPPEKVAEVMNRHRILVVPSRWAEPFGIVALEGAACGCDVIGSNRGGLPEAIGAAGAVFPSGDEAALADLIATRLGLDLPSKMLLLAASNHLANFTGEVIAGKYLRVLQQCLTEYIPARFTTEDDVTPSRRFEIC